MVVAGWEDCCMSCSSSCVSGGRLVCGSKHHKLVAAKSCATKLTHLCRFVLIVLKARAEKAKAD